MTEKEKEELVDKLMAKARELKLQADRELAEQDRKQNVEQKQI